MHQEGYAEAKADDALLIQKATSGDSGAFGELYDMYVDRVYRHVYYRVGNTADAEDLTQQAFIKAWQAIGRYKKAASPFIAWLITISHNLVVNFFRTRKDKVYLDAEIVADNLASGPEQVAEAEAGDIDGVAVALAQFEELSDFGDEISQIAQGLGLDTTTIEQLVAQATSVQLEILAIVYEIVPEQAKADLLEAMASSVTGYQEAVEALEDKGALGDIPVEPPIPDGIPTIPPEGIPPVLPRGTPTVPPEGTPAIPGSDV